VLDLLEDAKAGRPLQGPSPQSASPAGASPLSPSTTQALLRDSSSLATPPLSPQKGAASVPRDVPGSPTSPSRARPPATPPRQPTPPGGVARSPSKLAPAVVASAAAPEAGDSFAAIPRFYLGAEADAWPAAASAEKLQLAARLFGGEGKALDVEQFRAVAREVCELPGFFAPLLMHRVHGTDPMAESASDPTAAPGSPSAPARAPAPVTLEQFRTYWNATLRKYAREDARAFHVLRGERVVDADAAAASRVTTQYLEHSDFRPVLRELLASHPGLEFLKDSPEFQDRYLETVTYRIFFEANVAWNGKLTKREFLRSDLNERDALRGRGGGHKQVFTVLLVRALLRDVLQVLGVGHRPRLFGGQGGCAAIRQPRFNVQSGGSRFFASAARVHKRRPGKMGYEDFCWFVLAEEDKSNPLALEYWFRVVDLDGDGVLRARECAFFYEEQLQRMECLNQEPVVWEDVLCQMSDMLCCETDGVITMRDLRRCKLAGNFFNVLFNLNKFIAFESRDPFSIRREREEPHLTEWDRFARAEYVRLSMEEEEGGEGDDVWDDGAGDENGSSF
jgi:serine/threonine-protein phosphatase 2A regulatory subunit B''